MRYLEFRDVEKISKTRRLGVPFYVKAILTLLRPLCKIPLIKSYIKESIGGLQGAIFRFQGTGNYEKAAEVGLHALEKYRHDKDDMNHFHWWSFIKYTVDNLDKTDDSIRKRQIIDIADNGILPFKGYDVAHSFAVISVWESQSKDYERAIEHARIASEADATWAYPDYLLGCYSLITGQENAIDNFKRALKKDSRIISTIRNDTICQKHPEIIDELTAITIEQMYKDS